MMSGMNYYARKAAARTDTAWAALVCGATIALFSFAVWIVGRIAE